MGTWPWGGGAKKCPATGYSPQVPSATPEINVILSVPDPREQCCLRR